MSLAAALIAAVWVGTAHGFAPQAGLIGDDAPAPPPQPLSCNFLRNLYLPCVTLQSLMACLFLNPFWLSY